MNSEHLKRVASFMRKADQDVPMSPVKPDEETRKLRARLILEEAFETVRALGIDVVHAASKSKFYHFDFVMETSFDHEFNMLEVIDGICDSRVVNTGTLLAMGVHNDVDFQLEVDKNNLDKFGPGGYRDAGGKWIKPTSHRPPNLEQFLRTRVDPSSPA